MSSTPWTSWRSSLMVYYNIGQSTWSAQQCQWCMREWRECLLANTLLYLNWDSNCMFPMLMIFSCTKKGLPKWLYFPLGTTLTPFLNLLGLNQVILHLKLSLIDHNLEKVSSCKYLGVMDHIYRDTMHANSNCNFVSPFFVQLYLWNSLPSFTSATSHSSSLRVLVCWTWRVNAILVQLLCIHAHFIYNCVWR